MSRGYISILRRALRRQMPIFDFIDNTNIRHRFYSISHWGLIEVP